MRKQKPLGRTRRALKLRGKLRGKLHGSKRRDSPPQSWKGNAGKSLVRTLRVRMLHATPYATLRARGHGSTPSVKKARGGTQPG